MTNPRTLRLSIRNAFVMAFVIILAGAVPAFAQRSLAGRARFQNWTCASPKFCPVLKSTASTLSSAGVSAMTGAHVSLRRIRVGPAHPLLSIASKPAPGKSRSPATVGCAEAQASPDPGWERLTKSSGYSPVVSGVLGSSLSCSLILRRSFAGIVPDFDFTGA